MSTLVTMEHMVQPQLLFNSILLPLTITIPNLISLSLFILLPGLSHEAIARLLAERYAHKGRKILTLLVKEQKLTPAEMRRSCMLPQH